MASWKLNHLLIPYLALLGFLASGFLSSGGTAWYMSLNLPPWQPSLPVIAFIWALIFVSATWSLLIVWNKLPHDKRLHYILELYGLVIVANLVWCIAFFYLHLISVGVFIAFSIGIMALSLSALLVHRSMTAALLMLPYAAWVLFAGYLTYTVLLLNP